MVWGIDKETALHIAASFQQNAFIWVGEEGTPELIVSRCRCHHLSPIYDHLQGRLTNTR
jgi:hypothetical protein